MRHHSRKTFFINYSNTNLPSKSLYGHSTLQAPYKAGFLKEIQQDTLKPNQNNLKFL